MPLDSERRPPYFALAFIMFGSLVAYALVLGRTYRRLFQGSELATWVVAAGSLLVVAAVVIFGYCGHIYDFTFLALCAGMLSALLFERLPLYFVLFAISCWVKETTPLMTFAFLGIYWDRIPRRRLLLYLAGQVAAFVVAYGTVRLLFAHNGGANVEHWYAEELAWIGRKTAIKLALIASAIVAVGFRWRDKPAFLRRAFLSTVPVHLALFIYGARPGELRNLYESFPVVMLLLSRNFAIGPPAILSRVNQMRDHLRGSPQEAPAVSTGSQSVAATEPTGVGQTGPK